MHWINVRVQKSSWKQANNYTVNIGAVMAEWLRRWTRNPMGYSRAGSNPAHSVSKLLQLPCLTVVNQLSFLCDISKAMMAEWLRRWTWNPMGYSRAGSNPVHSEIILLNVTNFNSSYVVFLSLIDIIPCRNPHIYQNVFFSYLYNMINLIPENALVKAAEWGTEERRCWPEISFHFTQISTMALHSHSSTFL